MMPRKADSLAAASTLDATAPGERERKRCKAGTGSAKLSLPPEDDILFSKDMEIDLQEIIEGCNCWSPKEVFEAHEDAMSMPTVSSVDEKELECVDIRAVFEKIEMTKEKTTEIRTKTVNSTVCVSEKTTEVKTTTNFRSNVDRAGLTREEKKHIRQMKNRRSAKESRERRKMKMDMLEKEVERGRRESAEKDEKIRALEAQIAQIAQWVEKGAVQSEVRM